MKLKTATPEAVNLFREGMEALSQIEENGIRVDLDYLSQTIKQTDHDLRRLERELRESSEFTKWKKRFGEKTKLRAHAQLGTVVFDILGYKRKEVKNRRQTYNEDSDEMNTETDKNNESAFEKVDLEFVKQWFQWQKLQKVRNTYLAGIEREVEGEYLHPFFNLHIAKTYRSTSDSPNFQNYPVRNKTSSEIIRSSFIARDNHVIVENDAAGIEVRVGACNHLDRRMIQYIKNNYDYHKEYAAKCYMLDPKDVDKDQRYCAKNKFVFPEFYGSDYVNCSQNLWESIDQLHLLHKGKSLHEHLKKKGIVGLGECDRDSKPKPGTFEYHIQQVQKELWELFSGYDKWKDDFYNLYRKRGWFELKTGFVCTGLYKKNDVTNYPIQGAAFHCLLWVLIQLQKWLKKYKMKSKLVGQIHDSLIGDVHVRELDDYLGMVKHLFEVALPKHWDWIVVPMEIEAEIAAEGKSWHHKKTVKL